jgi:hypothetical protein
VRERVVTVLLAAIVGTAGGWLGGWTHPGAAGPQDAYQVLTKRAERMERVCSAQIAGPLPNAWLGVSGALDDHRHLWLAPGGRWHPRARRDRPVPPAPSSVMDGHLEATAAASRGEVIGADVGHSPEAREVVAALPRFATSLLDHRDRLGSPLHGDGVR